MQINFRLITILFYFCYFIAVNGFASQSKHSTNFSVHEITRTEFGITKYYDKGKKTEFGVKLIPEFKRNENITIKFKSSSNIETNNEIKISNSSKLKLFEVIDPNSIRIEIDLKINGVEKIVLFDNLAELSCKKNGNPIKLATYEFNGNKNIKNIETQIKMPCERSYEIPGQCPHESIVMVRLKTKDNMYFYNTKKIYTCIKWGPGS